MLKLKRTLEEPNGHFEYHADFGRSAGLFVERPRAATMAAMISVVIPTLNEAEGRASLLDALAAEPEAKEIIVNDGGGRLKNHRRHHLGISPARLVRLYDGAAPSPGVRLR